MRSVSRPVPALWGLLLVLGASVGCRAAPPVTAPPAVEVPVPDNAAEVAQASVDARVTVQLHLDRLQGFRFSKRLILLGGWDEALSGTGVDPLSDVHRAFIAARSSHTGDVALVLQHSAPEERVIAALAALQAKWVAGHPARGVGAIHDGESQPRSRSPSGSREAARYVGDDTTYPVRLRDLEDRIAELGGGLPDLSRFPFPAAYRYMKNDFAHIDGPALIAEPHPGLIVVLPPARAVAAFRFMEAGGLPPPRDGEAMVFRAWEPTSSIQNGPVWSPEVKYAEAVFTFDGAGNSTLKFRAVCRSAEAAKAQAAVMTTQVDDAQSVSIGGGRLRLFDYIEFHAENDRVKMKTNLMADDVDWLVAMSMKPM